IKRRDDISLINESLVTISAMHLAAVRFCELSPAASTIAAVFDREGFGFVFVHCAPAFLPLSAIARATINAPIIIAATIHVCSAGTWSRATHKKPANIPPDLTAEFQFIAHRPSPQNEPRRPQSQPAQCRSSLTEARSKIRREMQYRKPAALARSAPTRAAAAL